MISDSSIVINELNCWLNLMPGGEPSFHYSGVISIDHKIIERTRFVSVKAFYQNQMIHESQPILQISGQTDIQSESFDKFLFFSQQEIKVSEIMMKAENLNFVFEFIIDGQKLEKRMNDIQITRAY